MKIDAVFSGGGVKAFAFIGALESIEKKHLELQRVAGTSAGAIVAAFLASGFTYKEIQQIMDEINLVKMLDPPIISKMIPGSKWFLLYFQMGIYRGNKLEDWVRKHLAKKQVYTFGDLPVGHLKIVVSDLTLGRLIVLPDDLKKIYGVEPTTFPISKAVRMSAGFPYFFMPKKLNSNLTKEKSLIIDGGLLSNFPLWIFDNEHSTIKRPVLGIKLSESVDKQPPRNIKNAFDMLLALFSTMKQAHDSKYISKKEEVNIIFIPVDEINTMDFQINDTLKNELIALGKSRSEQFLKRWPN